MSNCPVLPPTPRLRGTSPPLPRLRRDKPGDIAGSVAHPSGQDFCACYKTKTETKLLWILLQLWEQGLKRIPLQTRFDPCFSATSRRSHQSYASSKIVDVHVRRIRHTSTPVSPSASGTTGEFRWGEPRRNRRVYSVQRPTSTSCVSRV